MSRRTHRGDIEVATFTNDCLLCAIGACRDSEHVEDRGFAAACARELERRGYAVPRAPEPDAVKVESTWQNRSGSRVMRAAWGAA